MKIIMNQYDMFGGVGVAPTKNAVLATTQLRMMWHQALKS